jgi:hypothetical protein
MMLQSSNHFSNTNELVDIKILGVLTTIKKLFDRLYIKIK